jgi:hypothetical protein
MGFLPWFLGVEEGKGKEREQVEADEDERLRRGPEIKQRG